MRTACSLSVKQVQLRASGGPGADNQDRSGPVVYESASGVPIPGTPQPSAPTLRIDSLIERRIPSALQSREEFAMMCHTALMRHCLGTKKTF